jgi:hypothetical protein
MVNIEPYDLIDDTNCRWEIKGYGVVLGKDIETALIDYFSDLEEEEGEQ